MKNEILVNAGPLIALFDGDDKYHRRIRDFLKKGRYSLITTTAIVTEVSHMLNFNVQIQIGFFEWIVRGGLKIHKILHQDMGRILELVEKYRDWLMDFADASLVLTAEKTGIKTIISIDADFDIYRLPGKVAVENIFYKR